MKLGKIASLYMLIIFSISSASADQFCNERVLPSTPTNRFELMGNEVRDLKTGLIWQRCSAGQVWDSMSCSGSSIEYTWSEALHLADGLWRLPNIKELASIVETSCISPAINETVFPESPQSIPGVSNSRYWSSSTAGTTGGGYGSYYAWGLNFDSGLEIVTYKSYYGYKQFARLVRSGS